MIRLSANSETVTIKELKAHTKVTDSQLDTEIEETDMISLAPNFNNIETLPVLLGLNPAEQQDVKYALFLNDMQTAMFLALRLWRKANPGAATYRNLVKILLRMGDNGITIATEVCKFSASIEGKHHISHLLVSTVGDVLISVLCAHCFNISTQSGRL